MEQIVTIHLWSQQYDRDPGFEPVYRWRASCDWCSSVGESPEEALTRLAKVMSERLVKLEPIR